MDCPDCRHANPPESKFCNECGARLPAGCPNCGHVNPEGSKFCNECGTDLTRGQNRRPAPETRKQPQPSDLQTLIPDEFAAKLAAARAQQVMVGERRVVTMLFCDLKGSTAAAGTLDPEEWAQIMNGVFEYMIRPVYRYEGTVARLMGDAILAFFGAPVAHEDDPQRAIMAALDIINGFKPYRKEILQKWGLEMNFRVGINTGLVMVGTVGSDLQMEYTALGDAINLAARMEQTAEPGTILVAEETYKLAAPVFEWEALGETTVKGREESLRTYRPIRKKKDPGRLRGIAGLDAPMVGREQESARIREAIQRLAAGVGGIVFITGEAGLGKSRLIRELEVHHGEAPVKWAQAASLSYESTQPYALFQRLLRHVYNVSEGDAPLEMWEKFKPVLDQFPPDIPDQGLVFEALFAASSLSGGSIPEGEQFKRQLFDLMTHLAETWTKDAPHVIVLDDLHWSDPASIELLVHLLQLTETQPLLLICAMRPERSTSAWEAMEMARRDYGHRVTEIALKALTAADTDKLVDHLLVVSDLPAPLRMRILEKTEGNPFFIEEIVRVLIDSGMVERVEGAQGVTWRARQDIEEIDIPGNLQSLLIARIDRLEDDARRTLQLASVIGRSFYYRILDSISSTISTVRTQLDAQLRALERAEMIRESARIPELEYAFRHALTQEAAYNTILLRERQAFHRVVGEAVEHLFADRLEDFYPLLAHHFREAGDPRAIRYDMQAGDAAFRLYAISEAISHYRNAAEMLKQSDNHSEEAGHIFERLGRSYELISEHARALSTYQEMLELARERNHLAMELAALTALGKSYSLPTPIQDPVSARNFTEQGLALAGKLEDRAAESRLLWISHLIHMYTGRMDRGIPFGERSAELARSLGMRAQLAQSLHDLGLPHMAVGDLEKSRDVLDESHGIWVDLGNKPMQAENRSNRGIERTLSGCFEEGILFGEESFRISEEIDNDWGRVNAMTFAPIPHFALGNISVAMHIQHTYLPLAREVGHPGSTLILVSQSDAYRFLGESELALRSAEAAVWDSEGFPPFRHLALAACARMRFNTGDRAGAEKLLEEARALSHLKTIIHIEIESALAEVEILVHTGEIGAAETLLGKMAALIEKAGARFYFPAVKRLAAEIQTAGGNEGPAIEILEEAALAARSLQHRTELLKVLLRLAALHRQNRSPEEADQVTAEAVELAGDIAGRVTDPSLKASFATTLAAEGIRIR